MTCLCAFRDSVLYLEALGQLAVVLLYVQGRRDVRAAKRSRCHASRRPVSWIQQTLHRLLRQTHSGEAHSHSLLSADSNRVHWLKCWSEVEF